MSLGGDLKHFGHSGVTENRSQYRSWLLQRGRNPVKHQSGKGPAPVLFGGLSCKIFAVAVGEMELSVQPFVLGPVWFAFGKVVSWPSNTVIQMRWLGSAVGRFLAKVVCEGAMTFERVSNRAVERAMVSCWFLC